MIFIENKYTKWYNNIIISSKSRILPTNLYVEKHHIIPKSMGGNDFKENIAILTAREHFVCHLLLTKMTIGDAKYKMIFAFSCMFMSSNNQQRYNSKLFEYSKLNKKHSDESKKKMSIAKKGTKQSAETIAIRVEKLKGRPSITKGQKKHSEKSKKAISDHQKSLCAAMTPDEMNIRMKTSCSSPESWTQERKDKISKANTGKVRTEEQRKNYGHLKGKPWPDARRLAYLKKKDLE